MPAPSDPYPARLVLTGIKRTERDLSGDFLDTPVFGTNFVDPWDVPDA